MFESTGRRQFSSEADSGMAGLQQVLQQALLRMLLETFSRDSIAMSVCNCRADSYDACTTASAVLCILMVATRLALATRLLQGLLL